MRRQKGVIVDRVREGLLLLRISTIVRFVYSSQLWVANLANIEEQSEPGVESLERAVR